MVIEREDLEVYGELDSGLTIVATLPRHLAGDRHPIRQYTVLTAGDALALAERLEGKLALFKLAYRKETVS